MCIKKKSCHENPVGASRAQDAARAAALEVGQWRREREREALRHRQRQEPKFGTEQKTDTRLEDGVRSYALVLGVPEHTGTRRNKLNHRADARFDLGILVTRISVQERRFRINRVPGASEMKCHPCCGRTT